MQIFQFDQPRGRIHQRLHGFLTVPEAEAIRAQVVAACDRMRAADGALTVLVDLGDYAPQSQAVNAITEQIATAYAAVAPAGFAAATTSALQRLRLRRVLEAVGPHFFDTPDQAALHLGWEKDWHLGFSSPGTPPGGALLGTGRRA